MYRICVLLAFIVVSCQNSKPQEKPIVYDTLPPSEVVEVDNKEPVYEAEVIETQSIDLSAGNEEILDPVDTKTAALNAQLKSQLQEQQRQIARLQQENMHLRDQKSVTKKTSVKQTKSPRETQSATTTVKSTKSTKKPASHKLTKNTVLEKDRDVILGEQPQKTVVKTVVQQDMAQEKSTTVEEKKPAEKEVVEKQPVVQQKVVVQEMPVAQEKLVYKEEKSPERQNVAYQIRKHCLRIISLPANQDKRVAEDIIAFLKQQDIEATHHTIQKYRVIDIVNVPEFGTPEAKSFQKRIHQLPYQGSLQFKDAYYTVRKY